MAVSSLKGLILSLSLPEKKSFRRGLSKGSNSEKLFRWIDASTAPVTKQQLFRKLTRTTYTREKDHLIRNEIGILRRKIERFMLEREEITNAPAAERARNFALAEKLYRRKLYALAGEKLEDARRSAISFQDWSMLIRINTLSFLTAQAQLRDISERLESTRQHAAMHTEYLQQLAGVESAYISYLHGVSVKIQKLMGLSPQPEEAPEITGTRVTTMSAYYIAKGKAYAESGIGSVPLLEHALGLLEKAPADDARRMEWIACAGQIASEYSAAGELASAEKWFAKILARPELDSYPSRNFLVLNYIITLVKAGKYKKSLTWIDRLEKVADEDFIVERLKTSRISCYIFLNDAINLKRALPKNFSETDREVRNYFRMQYSICFYLQDDVEAAEREMLNLRRTKNLKRSPYDPLVDLFILFYQLVPVRGQRPDPVASRKLEKAFSGFMQTAPDDVRSMIPARWLLREWERKSVRSK